MAKKILYSLLCLLVAGVIVFVGLFFGYPPFNALVKNAVGIDGDNAGDNSGGDQTDDGNVPAGNLLNVIEENGISLMSAIIPVEDYEDYGIDTQADKAYTVTATVNADAADNTVVGSLKFKNASSSWASGKTVSTYVTSAQSTTNQLSFTLTIRQAFGEPIEFTIASAYDSTIKATVQIDYLKILNSFTAVLNPSLASNAVGRIYAGDTKTNTVSITPNYGVGTVQGTISNYTTTFTPTTETMSLWDTKATAAGSGMYTGYHFNNPIVCTGSTFTIPFYKQVMGKATNAGLLLGGGASVNTFANNFIYNYGCDNSYGTREYTAACSSIKYEVTYTYGSNYSKTVSYTDSSFIGFRSDSVSLIKTVTSVTADKDSIVVIPD